MLADERHELLRSDKKRNCINKTEEAQNNKARQPIRISTGEKPSENVLVIHNGRWPRSPLIEHR